MKFHKLILDIIFLLISFIIIIIVKEFSCQYIRRILCFTKFSELVQFRKCRKIYLIKLQIIITDSWIYSRKIIYFEKLVIEVHG